MAKETCLDCGKRFSSRRHRSSCPKCRSHRTTLTSRPGQYGAFFRISEHPDIPFVTSTLSKSTELLVRGIFKARRLVPVGRPTIVVKRPRAAYADPCDLIATLGWKVEMQPAPVTGSIHKRNEFWSGSGPVMFGVLAKKISTPMLATHA